jgi:hypothetical protein
MDYMVLYSYTKERNLTVNIENNFYIQNGGKANDNEMWTYGGRNIEIVNRFN